VFIFPLQVKNKPHDEVARTYSMFILEATDGRIMGET
jgi:hypothetical protein